MTRPLLISAALLVVLISALWFAQLEPDPPPSFVPVAALKTTTPVAVPVPEHVLPIPDAGEPENQVAPLHVTFHVTRDGKTAVGERIELSSVIEQTSALVDSMGDAHFELTPGRWLHGARTSEVTGFEVTDDAQRFELVLPPPLVISGHVYEGTTPVPGALIESPDCGARTDQNGHFSCQVIGRSTQLRAKLGDKASLIHSISASTDDLRLQLVSSVSLRAVSVKGASLLITHGGGLIRCTTFCDVRVLNGPVRVLAIAVINGRKMRGVESLVASDQALTTFVHLAPAPPIQGVVTDRRGAPIRGLTVRAFAVPWRAVDVGFSREVAEGAEALNTVLGMVATPPTPVLPHQMRAYPIVLITDEQGRFALSAASTEPVAFWVEGAWMNEKLAIASPDDSRIEIVAVPIRPAEEGVRR